MWFWVLVAILGLAIGGIAIARSAGHRLRGKIIFGIAAVAVVLIQLLIRFEAITVGQGTALMALAVMMLIVAVITLTPLGRRGVDRR